MLTLENNTKNSTLNLFFCSKALDARLCVLIFGIPEFSPFCYSTKLKQFTGPFVGGMGGCVFGWTRCGHFKDATRFA